MLNWDEHNQESYNALYLCKQVQLVKTGKPYVMFGDGQLASCKPISEADLASFMADCVKDPSKANKMLPIGGKTVSLPFCISLLSERAICMVRICKREFNRIS